MKVAVTGASGFIGSYIVEILLQKGFHVRSIVRNLENENSYSFLRNVTTHKDGQLEFVQGNVNSYDEALQGCDHVIHLASPYIYSAKDPENEIVQPAIEGVKSIFQAALKAGIKRLIITSSGGAILHFPVEENYVFSTKDWSNQTIETHPYFYSKKVAEETAWKLYEENKEKIELVVINPLLVLGSPKHSKLNASQNTLKAFLMGEAKIVPNAPVGVCHVREVALAHVEALKHPNANGKRIIVYSTSTTFKKLALEMKNQFPQYPVTQTEDDSQPNWKMDTTELKEIGVQITHSLQDMVKDTVEGMISVEAVPDLRK